MEHRLDFIRRLFVVAITVGFASRIAGMEWFTAHRWPTQPEWQAIALLVVGLAAIIEIITADLKKGNNVVLTGFGTFRVSKRAARTGVNPRNPKEKINIPAMKVPVFKAGKALKEAVR